MSTGPKKRRAAAGAPGADGRLDSLEFLRASLASVQTNIYSVTDGKLIWSGTADLYNPSDARKVVGDIAKAVGDELRKEKLIQ